MECLISPIMNRCLGFVCSTSFSKFSINFGVCDGICIPCAARKLSQPIWRSVIIRYFFECFSKRRAG
jgi:hypothetical protein